MGNLRYSEWPVDLERARLWYEPHLDRIHEDAETRRADLLQLEQIASGYPSRERFLTELTLDPPDATSDQAGVPLLDEDYLILSTIHSAKGQEWKSVYLLNVVDGCMPSDLGAGTSAEIEEERRLLYVAMTRAKDDLHLIVPQRFFVHGQHAQGDRHVYASQDALHSRKAARTVRADGLAACACRHRGAHRRPGAQGGYRRPDARNVAVDGNTEGRPRVRHVRKGRHRPTPWLASLLERKPPKLVAVALANKFARIAWRLMISGGVYNQPVAAMPT